MPGLNSVMFIDLNKSLLNNLKCSICSDIFNKPVETECKHIFCEDCIQQWFSTEDIKECPICRHQFGDENNLYQVNRVANNIINDLNVKCQLGDCNQVFPFGSLTNHMEKCEFNNCTECGHLKGKVEQHDCLKSTKEVVNVLKDQLKSSEVSIEHLNSRVKELTTKLESAQKQLSDPLKHYVYKGIDIKTTECFQILNELEQINLDDSYIKFKLVAKDDKSYQRWFVLKREKSFKYLMEALMDKFDTDEKPDFVLKNRVYPGGYKILPNYRPLLTNMKDGDTIIFEFKE